MRFALSAVAGTSGLLLLGLAFYGQPSVYLQAARDEWNRLVTSPPADQSADPDHDAVAERVVALQQQVARLTDELAARQAAGQQTETATPPQPVPAPQAPILQAPIPQVSAPPVPTPQAGDAPKAGSASAPSAKPAPTPAQAVTLPPAAAQPSAPSTAQTGALKSAEAAPSVTAMLAEPTPPAPPGPQRKDLASAEPAPPKAGSPKPDAAKAESVRPESPKPEVTKTEPPKPIVLRLATARPPPPPPPLPSPPRQDIDDTQSVLARLRQIAPGTTQQPEPPAAAETRQPRPPPPSPSLPKLSAARAALASGRIEDARRLLQEAQLQLVFRPVNVSGDDQPLAGKGAADVAHALEALSANDIPLSRRYIDVAAGDLSGTGTTAPAQAMELRATGYAPAYPPR